MSEHSGNLSEHYARIDERRRLLQDFAENPRDDAIWDRAYDMVREEGDELDPDAEPTIAADVPAEALIGLAEEVRATQQADRYALMTRRAPNGEYWFDAVHTFSMEQGERAKLVVLNHLQEQGYALGTALDLGTGTGKSLATLEAVADKVIGADRNPDLLRLAQERKAGDTQLVLADATKLPFTDGSFDLVSSRGLEGSLSDADNQVMYHEIARILKPDGVYVTSSIIPNENGYKGLEMDSICWTSKAMLADMIVDSTSGSLDVEHNTTTEEYQALLEDCGLEAYGMQVYDEADDITFIISILQKSVAHPGS